MVGLRYPITQRQTNNKAIKIKKVNPNDCSMIVMGDGQ